MMRIALGLFICCLLLPSCEKAAGEVQLPPFAVFPNPFADVFHVFLDPSVPAAADVDLRIYDSGKKPVFKLDNLVAGAGAAVNLSNYEKGIYYIEVTIEGEKFIEPVLKTE